MSSLCEDTTLLGSFLENQDQPRFPSYTSDYSLDKNAMAFAMLADGIPILYEGQEQHYNGGSVPNNREPIWTSEYSTTSTLYPFVTSLNAIRRQAITQSSTYVTYKANSIYSDSKTIAMRKGSVISVYTNAGASGASYTVTLPASGTGFTASEKLVELFSCTSYTTDSSGNVAVTITGGLPIVFYPASSQTLCKTTTTRSTTLVTSVSTAKSTSCPTSVAVNFQDIVTTVVGQTIKLAGSVSQLGDWSTNDAVVLSASDYMSSNHEWFGTVDFAPGTIVQYKYINVASDGDVTWEADPNHTFTVPSCQATAVVQDTWQI